MVRVCRVNKRNLSEKVGEGNWNENVVTEIEEKIAFEVEATK